MSSQNSLQQDAGSLLSQAPQELALYQQIETVLAGRILDTSATQAAETVLYDQALRHHLVTSGRNLAASLTMQGLSVELQYCTSQTHGHPVPFLVVRDKSGALVVPTSTSNVDPSLVGSELQVVTCSGKSESCLETHPDLPKLKRMNGALVIIPSKA
jgi:hypothetical protein